MSLPRSIAWGRIRSAWSRSLALVLALAVALGVLLFAVAAPWAVQEAGLRQIAGLPLVIGPPGGSTDLVLSALRLTATAPPSLPMGTLQELRDMGAADDVRALGLHLVHRSGGAPVVGVSDDGRALLGGRLVEGRDAMMLGEAVVGAGLAERRGLGVDDLLRTDLSTVHDVARTQSFGLTVSGVLAPVGTALDDAVLVSLPTAWMLDGHLHGHGTAADAEVAPDLAGAGDLLTWRRVTDENRSSFHQHGAVEGLPLSLAVVWPDDPRALDLVLGELALRDDLVGVRPRQVLGELVDVLLQVRSGVLVLGLLVGAGMAGLLAALAGLLQQARREETAALRLVGATPRQLRQLVIWELVILGVGAVGLASLVAAGGLWALVEQLRPG